MSGTTGTPTSAGPTDLASQQQAVVTAIRANYSPEDIIGHLQTSGSALGQKVQQATAAGYSPQEIVDHLNPNVRGSSSQGIPVLAPVARGIAQAESGAANLADDLGATGIGSDIRSGIIQTDLQAPTTGADLASSIKSGSYGRALTDLPGAALEGTLPLGAGIAAGAAAPLVGVGAAAAALGTGAGLGAATQGDQIARARAANNGQAAPTAGDLAVGLLGGAGIGAASSIGLSPATSIAGVLGRSAARAGVDAVAPQAQALASSVGTGAGTQFADPSASLAAAATGAASRIGMGGVETGLNALPGLTAGARQAALRSQYASLLPGEQQQAADQAGAAAALKAAQTGTMGSTLTQRQAAQTVTGQMVSQAGDLAASLRSQGIIDKPGQATINGAMQAAADPSRVLTDGHLADVAALGLDPDLSSVLGSALRQTDALSRVGQEDPAGPVQRFAQAAGGPLAGAALGAAGGGHIGAELGGFAGTLLKPQVSAALGQAGGVVDRLLGLGQPGLVIAGSAAGKMLDASGVPVLDPQGSIQDATSQSYDLAQAQMAAIQRQAQDQTMAIQMNRQFDQNQTAGWKATLADAYGTNAEADKIEAARQQMQSALAARSNMADTAGNWMERQALAKFKADNPMIQVTGAGVLNAPTPSQVFDATGGRYGSPADASPNMNGLTMPQGQPSPAPAQTALSSPQGLAQPVQQPPAPMAPPGPATAPAGSVSTPGPSSVPTQQPPSPAPLSPILAAAQARADGMAMLQGSRQPQAARQAAMATMSPQLAVLSRYLPDWQFGLGSDLQATLAATGQGQPLNYHAEATRALGQLRDSGAIDGGLHDAIAGHGGRLLDGTYNALRNQMLLNYGIDRTVPQQ